MSNEKINDLSPKSLFLLGDAYFFGKKGKEHNVKEALKYYNIAAKQGHLEAQYSLGIIYYQGDGIPQNYERAFFWFEKASNQNHALAKLYLAQCYENGAGVEADKKQALLLYNQAAELGNGNARIAACRLKNEFENEKRSHEMYYATLADRQAEQKRLSAHVPAYLEKKRKETEQKNLQTSSQNIQRKVDSEQKKSTFVSPPKDKDFDIEDGVLFRYTGFSKNVRIPDNVKKVGACAFAKNKTIETIYLPNTVTSIGKGAFEFCENLKSVTISKEIIDIGEHAFFSCYQLESISFFDGLKSIGSGAFYRCEKLKSLEIPRSIKSIGSCAFANCKNLSVSLNKEITELETIPESAFGECSIYSITIPVSVKHIHKFAFHGCYHLKTIYYAGSEKQAQEIGLMDLEFCHAAIRFNWKK